MSYGLCLIEIIVGRSMGRRSVLHAYGTLLWSELTVNQFRSIHVLIAAFCSVIIHVLGWVAMIELDQYMS